MTKPCRHCNQDFEITEEDLAFYDKVSPVFGGKKALIPPPTLCFECRNRARMAFRNERRLYNQVCAKTGEPIISVYSPDSSAEALAKAGKPRIIYEREAWWSDTWDATVYGRGFDFSKSFTENFRGLLSVVPRMNMMLTTCENCDYSPYAVNSKNCYLCVSVVRSEDVHYSYQTNMSRDCLDCCNCGECELCYGCLYSVNLYDCQDCRYCARSSNLYFCQNCTNCSNMIGCSNLVGKEYHIFNRPVSKEEFESAKKQLASHALRLKLKEKAEAFFLLQPQQALHNFQCENVTGDNLLQCKNVRTCFDARTMEDCAYVFTSPRNTKDSQDVNYTPDAELCYHCMSAVGNYNTIATLHCWHCRYVYYSDECFNSSNLFGCVGMKGKEYCVLNKQYTKEEYEALVPRIIEHMKKSSGFGVPQPPPFTKEEKPGGPPASLPLVKGSTPSETRGEGFAEWGEFFHPSLSPFGYNETMAHEYYPLEKEQASRLGFTWSEYVAPAPQVSKVVKASQLPDSIFDIPDSILDWAIECEISAKPFRIIKQELKFLRERGLPLPRRHPDVRHADRMSLRNPRKLYERSCMKCDKPIQTSYPPERKEIVYCEECYLKEVY